MRVPVLITAAATKAGFFLRLQARRLTVSSSCFPLANSRCVFNRSSSSAVGRCENAKRFPRFHSRSMQA